jgi:hypothetical protein
MAFEEKNMKRGRKKGGKCTRNGEKGKKRKWEAKKSKIK